MHPFCYKSIYATSTVKYIFNTDFKFHYCLSAFCVLKSAWHLCSNNYIAVLYKWLFIVRTLQFSIFYCITCDRLLSWFPIHYFMFIFPACIIPKWYFRFRLHMCQILLLVVVCSSSPGEPFTEGTSRHICMWKSITQRKILSWSKELSYIYRKLV